MTTQTPPRQTSPMPSLRQLGQDLLKVTGFELWLGLLLPLGYAAALAAFAWQGWWVAAYLAAMGYTFYSYGSASHDLVHGNVKLRPWISHLLLSVIELAGVRSGHAYRAAHLRHHARFPHDDDVEGAAAHGSLAAALWAGPWHQIRIYLWALRHARSERAWILVEGLVCMAMIISAITVWPMTAAPAVYVSLVVLGSWTFPFVTSYLPHAPREADPLRQTKRFRGRLLGCVFRDHLYHLEHHLYPAVPHHRWPELARRLDPFLDRAGIPSIDGVPRWRRRTVVETGIYDHDGPIEIRGQTAALG